MSTQELSFQAAESSSVAGSGPRTFHAPAGRDSPEQICRQRAAVDSSTNLAPLLNSMPTMVMVLNQRRQVVAANSALLDTLGVTIGQVVERRPGEVLDCQWVADGPDGCGTGRHCVTCGAVDALLACGLQNAKVSRECRISRNTPQGPAALDLRVTASPLRIDGQDLMLVVAEDTSHAKRLDVLQRTFFHDVLNTAGCIQGYAQYMLRDTAPDPDIADRLCWLANRLIEDVLSHRDLVYAESGELIVQACEVHTRQFLEDLREQYRRHPAAEGRTIELLAGDGVLLTDEHLLARVLGNMVKNALEATPVGGRVMIDCVHLGANVEFSVHNAQVMPENVQLQVFQRSFSTKSSTGRGIGTFSMKLLGERYLGGKVRFVSREGEGTRFYLTLPREVARSSGR